MDKIKLIKELLTEIGEDCDREGLRKTPERFLKAFKEVNQGYQLKSTKFYQSTFKTESKEMVIVKDIDFYSLCEHHLFPFFGKIHIAYLPDKKVLGLSKFARIAEVFYRRLQMQERLNKQICEDIFENLKPLGVMVVIEAKHMCLSMRGVNKVNSETMTFASCGVFEKNEKLRKEFLNILK